MDEEKDEDTSTTFSGLASWGLKADRDNSNNLYITGFSYGDISSDSGESESDIFLAKYDTSGNRIWLIQETGFDTEDFAMDIAVAKTSGNIYIAGYSYGELESGADSGGSDIFVMKYNSAGIRQWVQQIGSDRDDFCWGIAIDNSENIYLTGSTYGVLPGSGAVNAVGIDLFLMKLDSSGDTLWVNQLGTENTLTNYTDAQTFGVALAVDGSNDIIVGGITNDTLGDSKIGNTDIILSKFDSAGNRTWLKQLGTSYDDYLKDVAVATSGNIYFTGYTYGTVDASYDYSVYEENHDYTEIFLAKYNSSGSEQWMKQAGSGVNDWSNSLAIDTSENVYITGETMGDVTGDNVGYTDLVILKYNSSGDRTWVTQAGSTVYDSANGITIDSSNDIYITGKTYGELNSKKNEDDSFSAFLSKYNDVDGSWIWTDLFGSD
ncbi:SBBP repeat-containing protein [bacterium]|nr:SBBP repeat-containing protein [bacterium]